MESIEFPTGIAYALSCLERENVTLKPKQEEAVYHLYHGQDVFAWFPTGYGKSLCLDMSQFDIQEKFSIFYISARVPAN